MKIAFFTNNYLPNPYGVAGSVESFRKVFESLGHEVYIFAPGWKDHEDKIPNVFRYPSFETNFKIRFPIAVPYSPKINKIIENIDLDVIHSQHPNLLGSAAAHWARKKKIPLVFTWHTLYDQYAHFVPFAPQRLAIWWTIRNARNYANKCDAVITPTSSVADIIRAWGVTNKNITAIPTGVEEEQFAGPGREKIRRKYNTADDDILLFVMTRLTAEKNMEFLVDAALEILKNNSRTKLMICGEGNLKNVLQKKVKETKMTEKVFFVGVVSEAEKKNYYAAGDIFIYASKSETQGMVLTEAMYSGLPIVAVRATGVKDIVEDGRTGILVREDVESFGEVVQKMIDDEDLRKKFGEEARRVAREKYTSKVCAEKMLEVYEKAIAIFPKAKP
ncbi:MAG TPA: glycosyltransferase [Candidatus Bathyarchaeia archaeon]|nr:glycosyltransferase [Candidatus Bathyarchaeia archaeon]